MLLESWSKRVGLIRDLSSENEVLSIRDLSNVNRELV